MAKLKGALIMSGPSLDDIKLLVARTIKRMRMKQFQPKTLIILALIVALTGFIFYQGKKSIEHEINTRAFKVIIDDKEIGIVRDKSQVNEIIKRLQTELKNDYNMEVAIHCNTEYESTHAEDNELTSIDDLKRNIKSELDYNVVGYGIQVDGKILAWLKTEKEAKEVLQKLKEPYLNKKDENRKIEEIKFVENVKIVKEETVLSNIEDPKKVVDVLRRGTDEERIHTVQEGESFWTISRKYNLTDEDLVKANPDKDPTLIHPGDELSLIVPKPFISVVTVEKVKYERSVKYDTKYEYTSSMYSDEYKVKRRGVLGKSVVVAEVEKHNGIEVNREVIEETLISEPKTQIVVKGTKDPPPKKGTGVFINPLPTGILTSRFGPRWGSMHYGIDLAARTGTPIKAADGGVVTYAGWKGNYGYLVEIDHGGGFSTRYGHCSKIYVRVGQKVYKGKTIAAVGNTGRSTGPHVHFEVRKYDKPVNPSNYIGRKYR
ncbi:M23 family metallopeptidase [Caldisalinibacter kiritimatiensis]|nr:M23 family metallopeptidase [Caldisalinibacter kiritimatiensis]